MIELKPSQKNTLIGFVVATLATIWFYIWVFKPLELNNVIWIIGFFLAAFGVIANTLNKQQANANLADKKWKTYNIINNIKIGSEINW